jgi:hypothetical protein
LVEIWVPYGSVEVSFDIKQENLSQIMEPSPPKFPSEELDILADKIEQGSILVLSGTAGVQKVLDVILTRNKLVKKLIHPKGLGSLCRRKAQEFSIQAEQLNIPENSSTTTESKPDTDLKEVISETEKLLLLSSVHCDPLFGLSSSASEVIRSIPNLKRRAFTEVSEEIPLPAETAGDDDFALKRFESFSSVASLEIVEKGGVGIIAAAYGDLAITHRKSVDSWKNLLAISSPKSERIIFGCGGGENDKNLTEAFGRALFPVLMNAALPDSEAKICMLAECGSGLGSEAFLRFVTGRLEPRSKIGGVEYLDGLEVLLSFQKLQREFNFNILTTLPKFYASKFDLKTIGGAREAPSSLVQQGSRAKILVFPDASGSFFKS